MKRSNSSSRHSINLHTSSCDEEDNGIRYVDCLVEDPVELVHDSNKLWRDKIFYNSVTVRGIKINVFDCVEISLEVMYAQMVYCLSCIVSLRIYF